MEIAQTVISVRGLGKSYRLGEGRGRGRELFWALRDVSFDVARGEVVGVVGANGAGKSTLLKILSRITEPTQGRAELYGRVSSLLEVGTGFHYELTGRENVYMNGAIHGLTRREINARFDAIAEFAGVQRFLDTPVKRYSSGMLVRLAFAVAANLDPEILVVDEVLAVGDAEFQEKCLGKMSEVASAGRTVLFVSHNLAAVRSLCSRAILLQAGEITIDGSVDAVIAHYRQGLRSRAEGALAARTDRRGSGLVRVTQLRVQGPDGDPTLRSGEPARFVVRCEVSAPQARRVKIGLVCIDERGSPLFTLYTQFLGRDLETVQSGDTVVCEVPQLPLAHGRYRFDLWVGAEGEESDAVEAAVMVDVAEGDFFGTGQVVTPSKHGPALVAHRWRPG